MSAATAAHAPSARALVESHGLTLLSERPQHLTVRDARGYVWEVTELRRGDEPCLITQQLGWRCRCPEYGHGVSAGTISGRSLESILSHVAGATRDLCRPYIAPLRGVGSDAVTRREVRP